MSLNEQFGDQRVQGMGNISLHWCCAMHDPSVGHTNSSFSLALAIKAGAYLLLPMQVLVLLLIWF